MKKYVSVVSVALLMLSVTGCKPKADGSSKEAFDASITKMEQGMDDAKKEQLNQAIQAVSAKTLFSSGAKSEEELKAKFKEAFDGKTADEIIADGEKAKAESKAEIDKMMKQ